MFNPKITEGEWMRFMNLRKGIVMKKEYRITVLTEYIGDDEFKTWWLDLISKKVSGEVIKKLKLTHEATIEDSNSSCKATTKG